MSLNFNTIAVERYIGIPQPAPTQLCRQSSQAPFSVPLLIDWNIYWQQAGNPTSVAVLVDLEGTTPNAAQLDAIRSVKIDNTFSTCPVYVTFPDTLDTITCPPQSVVIQPVNTNSRKLSIIAQNLTTGFIPQTRVTLFNVPLPATYDPAIQFTYPQLLGSPTIQRSNILTPGFGSPALGDQFVTSGGIDLTVAGATQTLLSAQSSGFYYITHASFRIFQAGGSPLAQAQSVFESTGAAGILFIMTYGYSGTIATEMVPLDINSQIKLDATQTWRYRTTTAIVGANKQGLGIMSLVYTHNAQ